MPHLVVRGHILLVKYLITHQGEKLLEVELNPYCPQNGVPKVPTDIKGTQHVAQ